MSAFAIVLKTFIISFLFAYLATPVMAKLALKMNFIDHPNGKKVHLRPTPLMGGLAIYFAVIIALWLTLHVSEIMIGVLIGGTVIMVIGLIDDKIRMMPRLKLLGQFAAAFIAVNMGLSVVFIKNLNITTPLDPSILFTLIWLLAITNAFNLLDNMNGLAAGVAAISAFFFGTIAFIHGDMPVAILSFALMGSCLGFLRRNFQGKIFMGDSGSLFLGFMLASIAVMGNWKTPRLSTSLAIPVLILAYPMFDMIFVIITRILGGEPIYKGGKDHTSHRFAQAVMESIRGMRSRKIRSSRSVKVLALTIWEFIRGLKKKGHDRAADRLANLGLKKKRAVFILYLVSSALGLAALAMTWVGKHSNFAVNPFDISIMIIAFILMAVFARSLGMVTIGGRGIYTIDNLILLSLCVLIIGLPFSNSVIEVAASAAIILWLIKKVFILRSLKLENTPLNKPILFYLLFVALSLINSQFLITSLRGFFFKTIEHFLIFFIIVETVKTKKDLKKIVFAILVSCTLIGINGLWQYATGYDFLRGYPLGSAGGLDGYPLWSSGRITASFRFPNGLGVWLITVIPLCITLAIFNTREKLYRVWGVFLSLLLSICLILNFIKGAAVAIGPAIIFLAWKKGDIAKKILLLFLIIALLGIGLITISDSTPFYIARGWSVLHRMTLTKMCWRMFIDHPFLGHGINTFMSIFENYSYDPRFSGISYAHNCYLQILVETGIFSLLAFLWMIIALFASSLKDINRRKDRFIKATQLGFLTGLLAYLVHSAVETNLYALQLAILFYYFLGVVISIQRIEDA